MKIIVNNKAPAKPKIKFPLLMESINHPDVIIYMTAPNKGMVVVDPDHDFGYTSTLWADIDEWVPFVGEIILSNK